uniref:Uncharacterized protein n=1 Tax=Oryza brachyantha TaxID=4533 RepID=J3NAX9_ORYBR
MGIGGGSVELRGCTSVLLGQQHSGAMGSVRLSYQGGGADGCTNKLVVIFHFNGKFLFDGMNTGNVNACEHLSFIDRRKVSLHEIHGQAKGHCDVAEEMLFH